MAPRKKIKRFKIVGRVSEDQKVRIDALLKNGYMGYTDIVSAALDLYCQLAQRYPVGVNGLPQVPELADLLTTKPAKKNKSVA